MAQTISLYYNMKAQPPRAERLELIIQHCLKYGGVFVPKPDDRRLQKMRDDIFVLVDRGILKITRSSVCMSKKWTTLDRMRHSSAVLVNPDQHKPKEPVSTGGAYAKRKAARAELKEAIDVMRLKKGKKYAVPEQGKD